MDLKYFIFHISYSIWVGHYKTILVTYYVQVYVSSSICKYSYMQHLCTSTYKTSVTFVCIHIIYQGATGNFYPNYLNSEKLLCTLSP